MLGHPRRLLFFTFGVSAFVRDGSDTDWAVNAPLVTLLIMAPVRELWIQCLPRLAS